MRCTQLIGLTQQARNYLKKYAVQEESYDMCEGMFGEPIKGNIYKVPFFTDGRLLTVKEVVQATPWSSGMMIFTSLFPIFESSEIDEDGNLICFDDEHDLHFRWFNWAVDPSLSGVTELDYEKGTYWC